jgi:glutaconate CoA-transferase subunit A
VNRSDQRGNVHLLGPDFYYDEWFAKAAEQTFVSCEQLVEQMEDHYHDDAKANIFERCFVTGVTEIKGGAHPTMMPPSYGWDMGYLKAYGAAAKDPGDWSAVSVQFVGKDEAAYFESVGGKEAVMALPLPIF